MQEVGGVNDKTQIFAASDVVSKCAHLTQNGDTAMLIEGVRNIKLSINCIMKQ